MQPHHYTQFKLGAQLAFNYIYARYHRMLFNLGKHMLQDEFVIENLVQDCFLKLWDQRESIESPKHLFFFLRFVMKRECISYYTRPRNQFYRSISRLENFENYQDYLLKDDAIKNEDHLKEHDSQQQAFDQVHKILPLLSKKEQRLIELCLNYGFQYKLIGEAMGSNTTAIYNSVQQAIEVIKNIIYKGKPQISQLAFEDQAVIKDEVTGIQTKVFELRCEKKLSFAEIAEKLGQTPKQIHEAFTIAYKYLKGQHEQQSA
jgi:RNA polymerase sigma factor (sigma-70 family)